MSEIIHQKGKSITKISDRGKKSHQRARDGQGERRDGREREGERA